MRSIIALLSSIGGVFGLWVYALYLAPSEINQGDIYRIIYLHVPFAFSAFIAALVLLFASIYSLVYRLRPPPLWGRAAAEIGLFFTILTLLTGSIWGRATWGTWWTWDARLTTTFILALLYGAYLLLWSLVPETGMRRVSCGIFGILIFCDIPIIYKSVSWWRTLHQPPSLFRSGGSTMSAEILSLLILCCLGVFALGAWMLWQRTVALDLSERLRLKLLQGLKF